MEHSDVRQRVYEVPDGSAVSKEAVEIIDGQLELSSPEPPPQGSETPAVFESGSRQEETRREENGPSSHSERPQPPEEAPLEQVLIVAEVVPEDEGVVETLVDAVKEKVSAVKDYLFDEANDVSKESDEALDTGVDGVEEVEEIVIIGEGDGVREEILLIREKLREDNPEMFYAESYTETASDDKGQRQKDGLEPQEELKLLQVFLVSH
jgi:hypothetical protein